MKHPMTVRRLGGFLLVGMLLLVGSFDPYYGGTGVLALALAVLVGAAAFLARAAWRGEQNAWLLLAADVGILVTTAWQYLRPAFNCAYPDDGGPLPCGPALGFWDVYAVGGGAALAVLAIGWLRSRRRQATTP